MATGRAKTTEFEMFDTDIGMAGQIRVADERTLPFTASSSTKHIALSPLRAWSAATPVKYTCMFTATAVAGATHAMARRTRLTSSSPMPAPPISVGTAIVNKSRARSSSKSSWKKGLVRS